MTPLLQVEKVSLAFHGVRAVEELSLEIYKGRVAALVGPNGAGKTTLFNIVTGFLKPFKGRIFLRENNITDWSADRIARHGVARTFQDLRLITGISVIDNVILAKNGKWLGESLTGSLFRRTAWRAEESRNREDAVQVLVRVGLRGCENQKPRDLSYGQQKLLTLGCCLSSGAELVLLDEPFAGVNPGLHDVLIAVLRELAAEKKAVLFIEHNLEVVRRAADEVIVMDHGSVRTCGRPTDVLSRSEVMEIYIN
jgi:ABC-type branched-subunit amino acid transport system ATPase component